MKLITIIALFLIASCTKENDDTDRYCTIVFWISDKYTIDTILIQSDTSNKHCNSGYWLQKAKEEKGIWVSGYCDTIYNFKIEHLRNNFIPRYKKK